MKITICGSIAFYKEMEELKAKLEDCGHEVLIPLLDNELPAEFGGDRKIYFGKYIEDNGGMDAFPPEHKLWKLKYDAINDHFEKIKRGEAIIVANHNKRGITGYVGGNTLIEMGLAFYLKKPIYVLNPISDELSYKQEIYGMNPILLNGDLNNII